MCLEQAGATAEALDAYRRAAASTGLTTPAVAFAPAGGAGASSELSVAALLGQR